MASETTPANVADLATKTITEDDTQLLLLGTFGPSEDLRAMVRSALGRTRTVGVGDRVGGTTVIAIEEGRLALNRNGTAEWIEVPG